MKPKTDARGTSRVQAGVSAGKQKAFNHWFCEKHDAGPMEHDEFLSHLKEHHGLDATDGTKGKREMLLHADGRDFYRWDFKWTINGETFTQSTQSLRRGADKAMWSGR